MKVFKSVLSILLVFAMLMGLVACMDVQDIPSPPDDVETPDTGETPDNGETPDEDDTGLNGGELIDGNWAGLDFKDATLTVSVSVNNPTEVGFKNAGVYTRGPDTPSQETVQKKVLARNKKVADDLNVTLEYQTTDFDYDLILYHLETLVYGDPTDAPDIYNNDVYSLAQAMLNGYLWNVTDPGLDGNGNEVTGYFDFSHEAWYKEYMEGATFSKDKQYLLAGDYNIDIMRFAHVLLVNTDLFDATFSGLTEADGWGFNTYESACKFIEDTGRWFYDDMIALSAIAHNDAGGSTIGKTDINDAQIGLCLNDLASRVVISGSGVSAYEWTKNGKKCAPGEGKPAFVTDTTNLVKLGFKYTELYNAKGVIGGGSLSAVDSVQLFMEGQTVMTLATLGEMETEQLKNTRFTRGILPFPRYSSELDGITAVVDDSAEVDCILGNTSSFAMASAFLQYVNELSSEVLDAYYEDVLKIEYDDDSKGARAMIDLVHDTVDSPFDSVMSDSVFAQAGEYGEKQLYQYFEDDAMANRSSTITSAYDIIRGALQARLEIMLAKFRKMQ